MITVIVVFLVLVAIGMPVAFAIGISGFLFFLMEGSLSLTIPPQVTLTQTQNFAILAIPMFIFAGNCLNETGMTRRLLDFASALTGHLRAGLAHVGVVSSFMMGGVTGSAIGDATMYGRVLGPGMLERKYVPGFAAGVIGTSAVIVTMVPPGTGLILYGTLGEVSIGRLFAAGVVPGVLMTVVLMLAVVVTARRRGYERELSRRAPLGTVVRTGLAGVWALIFPVILIVGLRFGVFTPSEAGAFAVAYALLVGVVIYRELTWARFTRALQDTVNDVGMIMLLISLSGTWGHGLTWDRIPQRIMEALLGISENPQVILIVLVVALLVAGMFMDSTVLILLLTTMLMPVITEVGIDPVHFGIVMVLTLTTGLLTPPIGVIMLVVCSLFDTTVPAYLRESVYLFLALVGLIVLLAFVPELALWLPQLIY
ncbi:TRAP transporter large permease [Actinobacteria bacterium YIM 96077]|uniref:C4-dicarboxylate ABC transporter n=1 Tax=Phytoactinopolyspora halophila TaxID=1981511 RepID=A0A329QP91_9ACTN|nr:TRAP transporter large permease [Phytoactinopolyspora halophila]AYY15049.1 TRAP transporter large permease [Actinobacteria bacterium YIM 96077]RAW14185.1 C4-dicarboxylate ABC transporter [Phytoactinopolyspora halophila]